MSKRRVKAADSLPVEASDPVAASAAEVAAATRCVCMVTGCGRLEADRRVAQMGAAKVKRLADLETSGKRREAVAILYAG